ncbi:leucine-rich repeat domain-containing protein [Treponema denticola]|uniref:leucine-rich repeat domain-containing protein n=1 Tax=Treponema denticola TaxID=158 RepID=UPI0020A465E4|nr:leucine-rich repeat domain-containing protein [Treponema denticola]
MKKSNSTKKALGASLILSPDHLTIKVEAMTEDGSDIAVEGCEETTLKSNAWTELHARGTTVILKGKITELDVSGTYENKQTLTALNVQGLTSLQKLYCYHNQLTELNVQGLTSLIRLECYYNQLTELNVQGLTSLKVLECYSNQLTELNVQGLTSLKVLECYSNQLTELNVQGLTALQKLYCSENQLTALNVQGLTALQELYCSYNQLTELNVQGRASLKELDCYRNKLNAQAMTELLNALPARTAGDDAEATLYTEKTGVTEGNCKDYTQPAELKAAFEDAKSRKWQLMKVDASGNWEDI